MSLLINDLVASGNVTAKHSSRWYECITSHVTAWQRDMWCVLLFGGGSKGTGSFVKCLINQHEHARTCTNLFVYSRRINCFLLSTLLRHLIEPRNWIHVRRDLHENKYYAVRRCRQIMLLWNASTGSNIWHFEPLVDWPKMEMRFRFYVSFRTNLMFLYFS